MRRSRSAAGLLFAGLLLHASPLLGQASPDSTAEARARFQAGLAAAQEGDLAAALGAFEAAYAIRPHYSVLYNIGRAYAGLGKHQQAVLAFERYLQEAGARLEAARRLGTNTKNAHPDDAGEILAEAVIALMKQTEMPNGLAAVGYTEADIPKLVEGTLPQHRVTKLSPRPASAEDLAALFKDAMRYW